MEDEWQQQQQPHHDENNMVTDEQAFSYEGYAEGQEYNNDNNENELENDDDDDDDILEMHDGGDSWKEAEGVLLMKFCPHDSSMLYPRVRPSDICFSLFSLFLAITIPIMYVGTGTDAESWCSSNKSFFSF